MEHLDTILVLMALLAVLYSAAVRINISYPILLVLAGLAIGLIPGLPVVHITPDLVFLLFLPPLLFDAARHMSWHDFKKNSDAINRLAIGLVLFTTVGVAVIAHYMIPGFSWPLAFLLGAIVSPPDAVAATSAIKGLHLPKRLVAILEGESLINDATALIAYRYALVAVVSGTFIWWEAAAQFFVVAGGGIFIGYCIGHLFIFVQKKLYHDSTVETILTLILPFLAYLVAEDISMVLPFLHDFVGKDFHMSGVLAVVTAGLLISWKAHEIFSFQTRIQMNNFWETIIFLLNGFVFILIGLQLPAIVNEVEEHTVWEMIQYGLLTSAAVVVIRFIWVFPTVHLSNWINEKRGRKVIPKPNRHLLILSWSGMRGVISLATALALPLVMANGEAFPQRNVILFITFVVILVTLVFQGLTLPLLIKLLKVSEPEEKEMNEERRLRLHMANNTMAFLDNTLAKDLPDQSIAEVKNRVERQARYLSGLLNTDAEKPTCEADLQAQRELFVDFLKAEEAVIDFQREMLIEMHKRGTFSAGVLKRIEQDLDSRSVTLEGRKQAFH